MLKPALRYLQLGFSVIPVKPRSKEPLLNWKEFQTRRASEAEIREWFKKWPNANVGIITGNVSRVVIVDLDGPEGIAMAQKLCLTSCVSTITGRGKHLWFKHPGTESVISNAVRTYPGVDIRGDGGFVLVAPSIHPNGVRYRFNRSVLSVERLPPFPAHIFVTPAAGTVGQSDARNEKDWISKDLEAMTNGNIDITLFRVCAEMRNKGYSEADAFTLLKPHAERAGAERGHLEDKIKNVWGRYQPKTGSSCIRGVTATAGGSLILHSPTNPDSLNEYQRRVLGESRDESLRTGYPNFDTLTKGLRKGEVLTVAARTGVGKTNWVITPIRTFCEAGNKVLLFSTEMSFDQIWQRYTATLADSSAFKQHALFICDEFTPNIERIEEAIKNVSPDLFIFDHISHIGTDYHIISKFMSEIKRMSRLYNIPAIVTAQLNRNADYVEQGTRIEPRLSMIQGSDQIGQMSAQVLLLNEKRINGDVTEIEGIVVKNRHGDKGLVQFGLVKNPYRMIEL